jgi:LytS/YehU family sensor histidine kinase
MSIQMLIENAIKHNIVSVENPLHIELSQNSDYIMIKNNLQPRTSVKDSGGIGLKNLKSRYALLSDKELKIEDKKNEFIVSIPVLKASSV